MLKELVGPPEFAPGQEWRYSTTGFRLAREIIERETGQPIAEVIQARLDHRACEPEARTLAEPIGRVARPSSVAMASASPHRKG